MVDRKNNFYLIGIATYLLGQIALADDLKLPKEFKGADNREYCFIEPLGRGGLGIVVKAIEKKDPPLSLQLREAGQQTGMLEMDPQTGFRNLSRPTVAIKLPISGNNKIETAGLKTLKEEKKILYKLKRERVRHVPKIRRSARDESGGVGTYFSMDVIKGSNLAEIDLSKRSLKEFVGIFIQVAETLEDLHRLGIVHRDIKLGNIMIDENGRVYIIDFGIAVDLQEIKKKALKLNPKAQVPLEPYRDPSGTLSGTPLYMSGRYLRQGDITLSMDIHALAVTMYAAMLNRFPTTGDEIYDLAEEEADEMGKQKIQEMQLATMVHKKMHNQFKKMPFFPRRLSYYYDYQSYQKLRSLIHSILKSEETTPSAKDLKEELQKIYAKLKD